MNSSSATNSGPQHCERHDGSSRESFEVDHKFAFNSVISRFGHPDLVSPSIMFRRLLLTQGAPFARRLQAKSTTRSLRRLVEPTLAHTQNRRMSSFTVVSTESEWSENLLFLKKVLTTMILIDAPAAIGPYSQAIKAGNLVFVSGCVPFVPSTMQIIEGGIEAHVQQALTNLKAVVEASGSSVDKIVKTTVWSTYTFNTFTDTIIKVFLKNMNDFAIMNELYAKFFGSHKPARSAVEVARLPKDVLFEIECIALVDA